ncbi:hypothetical protein OROHE_004760 [Orobanche hederae]
MAMEFAQKKIMAMEGEESSDDIGIIRDLDEELESSDDIGIIRDLDEELESSDDMMDAMMYDMMEKHIESMRTEFSSNNSTGRYEGSDKFGEESVVEIMKRRCRYSDEEMLRF